MSRPLAGPELSLALSTGVVVAVAVAVAFVVAAACGVCCGSGWSHCDFRGPCLARLVYFIAAR